MNKHSRSNDELARLSMLMLSHDAADRRVRGEKPEYLNLGPQALREFCQPVRDAFDRKFSGQRVRLSVIIRAFDEEKEILPTLLSYALSDVGAGLVEIIVADNNSTDRTGEIVDAVGAKRIEIDRKGIGNATKGGYDARSTSSEFVVITDADTRVLRPLADKDSGLQSLFLSTVINYFSEHLNCAALSTGVCRETSHWLLRFFGRVRGNTTNVSYWTGPNQAIRTSALDGIGGINPNIEFGSGEDHYRLWNLVRYCKRNGLVMETGGTRKQLDVPVYASSRRTSTLARLLKNRVYLLRRGAREIASDGMPVFKEGKAATHKSQIR